MTNPSFNQGQMPEGGNPQMTPTPDGGRKGLIIAICVVSVLVLALGGFIAYKLLSDDKKTETVETTATQTPNDSLATDTLSKNLSEGDGATNVASEAQGRSDAELLGFIKGVKEVLFGFEAGFGYTYYFDRDGQLTSVHFFDHENSGDMTLLHGKALKVDGLSGGCEDCDEPPVAEENHYVYEYRTQDDKTDIYISENGQPSKLLGSYNTDDKGRIIRMKSEYATHLFTYDADGRAFNQDGEEVYPPLVLFFNETPTLPKKHTVREKDEKGRPIQADAYEDMYHYTIKYWE